MHDFLLSACIENPRTSPSSVKSTVALIVKLSSPLDAKTRPARPCTKRDFLLSSYIVNPRTRLADVHRTIAPAVQLGSPPDAKTRPHMPKL